MEMVSVQEDVPSWVQDADVETFFELHDPPRRTRQRLRNADEEAQRRLLARAWFNLFHGSRHEAKKLFVLFMRESGIPFDGEDIQAITENPPVDTQT